MSSTRGLGTRLAVDDIERRDAIEGREPERYTLEGEGRCGGGGRFGDLSLGPRFRQTGAEGRTRHRNAGGGDSMRDSCRARRRSRTGFGRRWREFLQPDFNNRVLRTAPNRKSKDVD